MKRTDTNTTPSPDPNWRWTLAELRPNGGRMLRWGVPVACIAGLLVLARTSDGQTVTMAALCMAAAMGVIAARGYGLKARALRAALIEMETVRDEAWETREAAEAANAAKSQFLAAVSHEVRTPLSGILGMNGLLADSKLTGEQRAYSDAIGRSGEALIGLIDDLLDLTLIEKGRLSLEPAPVHVGELAASVVELLSPRADDKGLDLALYVAPDVPPTVLLDAGRMRQILTNIVGNAIKFTQSGGALVEVEMNGPNMVVRVLDSGSGVPELDRERLFEEFERYEATETRTQVGLGLGLAISRRLATAMGGTLAFADQTPGSVGTAIELTVPVAGQAPAIEAPSMMTPISITGEVTWVGEPSFTAHVMERACADAGLCFRFAPLDGPFPDEGLIIVSDPDADMIAGAASIAKGCQIVACLPAMGRERLEGLREAGADGHIIRPLRRDTICRLLAGELLETLDQAAADVPDTNGRTSAPREILFVEDDPINRLLVKTRLERRGHRVTCTANAHDALATLLRPTHIFDALITDLHMPGLSGQQLLGRLRAHEARLGAAPVTTIVLTADARAELVAELAPLRPAALLTKPLDVAALLAAVEGGPTADEKLRHTA